jgi:hypothetical protein
VLGEMVEVSCVHEWLQEEGIDGSNFRTAFEFWLVPEGRDRHREMASFFKRECAACASYRSWHHGRFWAVRGEVTDDPELPCVRKAM